MSKSPSARTANPASGRARSPRPAAPGLDLAGVSAEARRWASVILEVLAGLRSPPQAAVALSVSLPRYYAGELRALQGLLHACQPRPHGRVRSQSSVLTALQRECEQLRRQCARQQTLLRLAQRTVGVPPTPPAAARPSGKKQRRRRPTVRALRVVDQLRQQPEPQSENGVNDKGVTA